MYIGVDPIGDRRHWLMVPRHLRVRTSVLLVRSRRRRWQFHPHFWKAYMTDTGSRQEGFRSDKMLQGFRSADLGGWVTVEIATPVRSASWASGPSWLRTSVGELLLILPI